MITEKTRDKLASISPYLYKKTYDPNQPCQDNLKNIIDSIEKKNPKANIRNLTCKAVAIARSKLERRYIFIITSAKIRKNSIPAI